MAYDFFSAVTSGEQPAATKKSGKQNKPLDFFTTVQNTVGAIQLPDAEFQKMQQQAEQEKQREQDRALAQQREKEAKAAEEAWNNRPWYKKATSYVQDTFLSGSNIKQTAKGVVEDVKNDPVGAATAVPIGLFDAGSKALNSTANAGQDVLDWITKKATFGKVDPSKNGRLKVPVFSEQLKEFTDLDSSAQYGGYTPRPDQETDTAKALRDSATNVAGYEMGNALSKIGGIASGVVQRTLGNIIGGQIMSEADSLEERGKQALFDGVFGLATEGAGKVISKGYKAFTPRGPAAKAVEAVEPGAVAAETKAAKTALKPGEVTARPDAPADMKIVYKPKANLGKDLNGNTRLAITEFDNETGQAIVYYRKGLEKKPQLLQQTLEHEYGHAVDKFAGGGSNISSRLKNYPGNKVSLDETFATYAAETGKNTEQLSNDIAEEILRLSQGHGSNSGEQFAEAIRALRANADTAEQLAPTLSGFLQHVKVQDVLPTPRYTTHSLTEKALQVATKEKVLADVLPKASEAVRYEKIPERTVLKGTEAKPLAGVRPENIVHFNQGKQPRVTLIVPTKDKELITIASRMESLKATNAEKAAARAELRRIAADQGVSEVEARAAAKAAYEHYKAMAREVRAKEGAVIYNSIGKETADRAAKQATKSTLAQISLKQTAKAPIQNKTLQPVAQVVQQLRSPILKKYGEIVIDLANKGDAASLQSLKEQLTETLQKVPKESNTAAEANALINQIDTAIKAAGEVKAPKPGEQPQGVKVYDDNRIVLDAAPEQKEGTVRIFVTNKALKEGQYVDTDLERQVTRGTANEPKIVADIPYDKADEFLVPAEGGRAEVGELKLTKDLPDEYVVYKTGEPDNVARTEVTKKAAKEKSVTPGEKPAQSAVIAETGLDTKKRVTTESYNPAKINAPEEVDELFAKLSEGDNNFATQRISKSDEDIRDLSRMVGLTEEQLLNAAPGSIANAETVTAARQLVLDKAAELSNSIKEINPNTATPAQLKEFRDKLLQLTAMQKAVAGFRTEASNVFRSLKLELRPGENATLQELMGELQKSGLAGEADLSIFSNKVAKQMEMSKLRRVGEGALSTWYASILSGPKTTVRNVLSTGSNLITELAAAAGNPKRWREIPSMTSGLLRGLQQGWGEAKAVLKGQADTTTKFMDTTKGALEPEVFTGKWRTYGQVVESVGRFLNAQDTLLKAGAREMERAALKVANPEISDALSDAISRAYGERTVYHGKPTGRFIGAARDSVQVLRRKFPESKVIIPFVDTVANVLDRQFDYIPIFSALRLRESTILRQVDNIAQEFNITGAAEKKVLAQRLRDQQLGRMVLGTAVAGAGISLAAQGKLSGNGPTSIAERQQLMAQGWRPNSIKIGDKWVPYTYFGPLAGLLSMAGNVHDKTYYDKAPNKDIQTLITKGMVGWVQTQLQQSFLSGTADLIEVANGLKDPQAYVNGLVSGLVPVPKLYTQSREILQNLSGDAQQYDARTLSDKIRLNLGITGNLQPRLDAMGKPVKSDLIYGVTPGTESNDPVLEFLNGQQIVVSKPSLNQQYSVDGKKQALTPEQYTRYVKEAGQEIYDAINSDLTYLADLDPDEAKKEVQKLVDRIRDDKRDEIFYGQ